MAAVLLATAAPAPNVTIRFVRSGCLRLQPDSPLHMYVRDYTADSVIFDQTVSSADTIATSLKPGFYSISVDTPRCWPDQRHFVVGIGLRRTLLANSTIVVPTPKPNGERVVVDVYEGPSSGVVLHAPETVTRVTVQTPEPYAHPQSAQRFGDLWYLDNAGIGYATIRFYIGRRLARADHALLRERGFLERFYPSL